MKFNKVSSTWKNCAISRIPCLSDHYLDFYLEKKFFFIAELKKKKCSREKTVS